MKANQKKRQLERMAKLEQMKREREEYLLEKQEYEQRSGEHSKDTNSEVPETNETNGRLENFRSKTTIPETFPGREVIHEDKRYQNFTFGELIPNTDDVESQLASTRMLLRLKMLPLTALPKKVMKQLFYLMSLDDDCVVSESCCSYLCDGVNSWIPKMAHIINVFTNWGASYESLGMSAFDIALVYPLSVPKKRTRTDELPKFCDFHHEHVFEYLKAVIPKSRELDLYTEKEVLVLMRIFVKLSLDKRFPRIIESIKYSKLINTCLETIQNWNHSRVIDVAKSIYDENECVHNLITIATKILPKISRCNELRSCIAFALLRRIILCQNQIEYPNQDTELLGLVKGMNCDQVSPENMTSMYFVVLLVHSCIHGRGMLEEESMDLVEGIQDCLEKVKVALSRQPNNYDAELLSGHISACTAVWNLFGHKEADNYSQ